MCGEVWRTLGSLLAGIEDERTRKREGLYARRKDIASII